MHEWVNKYKQANNEFSVNSVHGQSGIYRIL